MSLFGTAKMFHQHQPANKILGGSVIRFLFAFSLVLADGTYITAT